VLHGDVLAVLAVLAALAILAVFDADVDAVYRLSISVTVDLERPLLPTYIQVLLHLGILHRTSDEPSRVENDVLLADTHIVGGVLSSATDERKTPAVAKCDPCRRRTVALLVGDDLDATILITIELEGDAGGGRSQIWYP
jgi:hypothetical protein